MKNSVIKRDSLSKQVSDKLETMIESGKYAVGERIPTEPELMDMFSVSRNTIREAVQSLTWAGILEVKQGDGTYVRSSNRFHANMNKKFAQTSLSDIREARNCIEVTIAHLASVRHTDDDMKKIKVALDKRNNLIADIKENTMADLEFHMTIADACHNNIIIDLYHSMSDYLEDHITERHMDSKLSPQQIDELHCKLYDAILDRNSENATVYVQKILDI